MGRSTTCGGEHFVIWRGHWHFYLGCFVFFCLFFCCFCFLFLFSSKLLWGLRSCENSKLLEKILNQLELLKPGVTWHATERGKVRLISLSFCVWTNKPQGLTAIAVRMKVESYQHSMTYNRLDREGNVGHCSSTTGRNRGGKKKGPNDWPYPLAPKWYLFVRGNLENNLEF